MAASVYCVRCAAAAAKAHTRSCILCLVAPCDGDDLYCSACSVRNADGAERTARISRGELSVCVEGATAAEQETIIRNRGRMNISGQWS
jgi:hypothetical protein